MTERWIIHIDVGYFFAQAEMRDNPRLRGKPVIVGGKVSSGGAVSTASYEAQKYSVHPAMSMSQAHELYLNGYLVISSFGAHRRTPTQIMFIFRSYTDEVEPTLLDEAYLDVTELARPDSPVSRIAQYIRKDTLEQTHLTVSTGVSYSKFLTRLASGMNKFDGMTVISYQNVHDIPMTLDIGDFPGISRASKKVMHDNGIFNGRDLCKKMELELMRLFGKRGRGLYNKTRGIDHGEAESSRVRGSVGAERTFVTDVNDDEKILRKVRELSGKTVGRLNKLQKSTKTVTIRIKTHQFETLSKQMNLRDSASSEEDIYNTAYLFHNNLEDSDVPIWLIGATAGNLEQSTYRSMMIYNFI